MKNRGINSNMLLNSIKRNVNNNPELHLTISQQSKYDSTLNFHLRTNKSMKNVTVELETHEKEAVIKRLNEIFTSIKNQVIEKNIKIKYESDIQNINVIKEMQRRAVVMVKYEFDKFSFNENDIEIINENVTYLDKKNIIVTELKKKLAFKSTAKPTKQIIVYN